MNSRKYLVRNVMSSVNSCHKKVIPSKNSWLIKKLNGNNSNSFISMSSKTVKRPMKMLGKSMISRNLSVSMKKKGKNYCTSLNGPVPSIKCWILPLHKFFRASNIASISSRINPPASIFESVFPSLDRPSCTSSMCQGHVKSHCSEYIFPVWAQKSSSRQ